MPVNMFMFNGFTLLRELQHNYSVLLLFCEIFAIGEFPQCLLDGFSTKRIDHNKIKVEFKGFSRLSRLPLKAMI